MFYTLNWAHKKANKMQGKARLGQEREQKCKWELETGKWKMEESARARSLGSEGEAHKNWHKDGTKKSRVVSFLPRDAFYEWIRGRDSIDTKLLQYKRIADDRGAECREGSRAVAERRLEAGA